ncbi:family 16 glycoside hydrolase [Paludibaculum fermentans]|uniref:family 16 glycoside hydrolase n=1 Tax=Paludibaculum fermentans TaxID=1473598 RepID=UPI003EBC9E58
MSRRSVRLRQEGLTYYSMKILPLFLCPLFAVLPCAAQTPSLEEAMGRPILAANQPLVEVQVYTASRVKSMPLVSSAQQWTQAKEELRQRVLKEVVLRGEGRKWADAKTRVEWLDVLPGRGYRIKRLRYEVIPGLWIPALLYEPEKLSGKVPVILNTNGHEGAGVANDYIQIRCINQAKKGALALNFEWLGMGQLKADGFSHTRTNQLDLLGTSGVALHYLSQKRGLDILLGHPNADPSRVAVTGLSGGGWQTILISSLDPRVTIAVPVAGYSSFVTRAQFPDQDLGDSEQTPVDLASIADYTTLTAMRAPKPTMISNNAYDNCCFRGDYANAPLIWAARPYYELYRAGEKLSAHINFDAGHNYGQENREAFYRFVRDNFYGGHEAAFSEKEIPSEGDVRTPEELRMELPADNLDIHKLALRLSEGLPRKAGGPGLAEVVKAHTYRVSATEAGPGQEVEGIRLRYWRLRLDNDWTLPVIEMGDSANPKVTLLIGDQGRGALAGEARRLVKQEGRRVIAVDPFYSGESKIAKRDWLFALLVSSVGDRPLGIQASQIAAVARWAKAAVTVESFGPRTSLIAAVAAVLEPKAIPATKLHGALSSLHDVLRSDMTVDKFPEFFTFGLLAAWDLPGANQWQSLFDGKTSAGWRTLARPQFPTNGGWSVEEGSIRSLAKGKRADISTERSFRNFELMFDWKLAKGTNSGVKYLVFGMRPNPEVGRIDPEVPKALGLELQLIDDERVADAKVEPSHGTGALYLFAAPTAKLPPLQIEEWHTARILVQGSHVEHWLDGVKVLDVNLESEALRKMMAAQEREDIPKLKNLDELKADALKKYPLVITHHGGDAWYRNIRIRELE